MQFPSTRPRVIACSVVFFLATILVAGSAVAQPAVVQIEYHADGADADRDLMEDVESSFASSFVLRGIETGASDAKLSVGVSSFFSFGQSLVALAIVEGTGLSREVIEAASGDDAWFQSESAPELPEVYAWVLREVTTETMNNLMQIQDIRILTFDRGDMERTINEYVDSYIERYSCPQSDECS